MKNHAIKNKEDEEENEKGIDWYDIPSEQMTLEQARQAVKELRKELATMIYTLKKHK